TTSGLTDDGDATTRVAADSLTLSGTSVGQSSGRIQTTVNNLTVDTSGGDAYIDQSGALLLKGNVTGNLDVQSSGILTVGTPLSATTGMSLATTGSGVDIDVN